VGRSDWAYLTRSGSERDLIDELGEPAVAWAEGVVRGGPRPKGPDGHLRHVTFARQAMRRPVSFPADTGRILAQIRSLLSGVRPRPGEPEWTWTLQVVAPDASDPEDPRRNTARRLEDELEAEPCGEAARRTDRGAAYLVQVWILDPDHVVVGMTPVGLALSPVAGGRVRLDRPGDAPSRSGLKLEEAILWSGTGPEKGELVADLGAAPGGWSQVALARGATVIAVDLGAMKIDAPKKRFAHAEENAFRYAPPEMLDWVLCDMAYRPLEVAKLLAKWGRRSWARQMIANIKLPMKRKVEMLGHVLKTLEDGGWRGLRARQLYHDRDEVTVVGWLEPGRAHRPARAPFRPRGRRDDPRGRTAPSPRQGRPRSRSGGRSSSGRTEGRRSTRDRRSPRKGPRRR